MEPTGGRDEPWVNIRPGYAFVTSISDVFHIFRVDPDKSTTFCFALCGAGWMFSGEWAEYPAKAMKVSELCPECLRDFLARTQS